MSFYRLALLTCLSIFTGLLAITAQPAFGQLSASGLDQFGTFQRNHIQTMNLFNLNNHIEIPLLTKKERGVNFYAKLVWDQSDSLAFIQQPYPPGGQYFQPSGGPELFTVTDVYYNSHTVGGQTCSVNTGAVTTYFDSIVDQNNTVHPLPYGSSIGPTGQYCGSGTWKTATNDGQWLLSVTWTDQNCFGEQCITSVTETDASGNVYGGSPSGSTTGLTDPNGNQVTKSTSSPGNSTWTDPTGNTVFTAQESSLPYTFSYPIQTGTANVYLNFTSGFTLQNNFRCNLPYTYTSTSFPTSIALPDGSSYSFVYESTNGTYPSTTVTGRIHSIKLPAGGTYTYTYSGGTNGINCTGTPGSPATITITGSDGSVWTYNRTVSTCTTNCTGPYVTTLVTDPACNDTVYAFDANGLQLQVQSYQGTAGTASCSASTKTLLRTISTCYNGNYTNCGSQGGGTPVSQMDQYTYLPGLSQPSLSETLYNSIQLPTQDNEFDFGVNTGSAPTTIPRRATKTTYASIGSNILNRPVCVQVTTGLSPSSCGTVTSTTNSITIYSNYSAQGNVGSVQDWIAGSSYATHSFTYYPSGLINVEVDPPQTTTTYTYGDCNNSYPTQVTNALNQLYSMTWDCNGGVVTQIAEPSEPPTAYTYNDPFWRVRSMTDPLGNVTSYNYLTPTTSESVMNFYGSVSTSDTLITTDGLGRPMLTQKRQAQGSLTFDSIQTTYGWTSGVGAFTTVSMPYAGTAGETAPSGTPVTTTQNDAVGRPLSITDGGGGMTSYLYAQNDVLQSVGPPPSGENTKRRQLEYDGLGRLTSVCEVTAGTSAWPGGNCAQTNPKTGYLTKYTYDALGDLTRSTQNAQGTAQSRSYVYDGLSRLTSETNPENGTTSYTYDSDTGCGTSSAGDLVKRVDALNNVTCYAYDAIHRNTKISYSGPYSSVTPTKYFVYDGATVDGQNMGYTVGRLAEAYTGSPTSKTTDIGFTYNPIGEVMSTWESTPHSGGFYQPTAAYWANGSLENLWISQIPSISYTPDGEGRMSTVSATSGQNPVTAVNYVTSPTTPPEPIGALTQVTFGSGDSDTYQYYTTTGKMKQYKYTVNGTAESGSLGWNPNGTLGTLGITDPINPGDTQNCTYGYDDLTRIGSANCGSVWGQTFAYDPFGNIDKSVTTTGVSWQPTYNTKNQYQSLPGFTPSYDANGNSLADSFHNYTWDAEGKVSTIDSIAFTYDALGRNVEQNRSGSYYQVVYSPLGTKLGIFSGQTLQEGFVPLPGGAQAEYLSWGLSNYRHPDWLGSDRLESTTSHAIVSAAAYAPFGEPYAESGSYGDLSFTGANKDTLWLDYDFLYREYDPKQGRWISPDPAGRSAANPTNPQSWNRYAYVLNNPFSLVDPTGLDCVYNKDDGSQTIVRGDCLDENDDGVYTDCDGCLMNKPVTASILPIIAPNILPCSAGLGTASNNTTPTLVTDRQGNPSQGVNPNGSVSPMLAPVGLPPNYFAGTGQLANRVQNSTNPWGIHPPMEAANLAEFAPGGAMDAQRLSGQFDSAYTPYANYAFGIYTAAAGLSLSDALHGANIVAGFANYSRTFARSQTYPNMLQSNVTNITNGYNAYVSGQVCTQ